ncbi:MAG: N-glycosylase/DNA lyase [Thermotogae bacterium]|nr:N-glycosylase/DNA lyase [Thermotogota bacterium]
MNVNLHEIEKLYTILKPTIERRIEGFKYIWSHGDDERIFAEFSFCLLTPQSKAKRCWHAVENLMETGVLFKGEPFEIRDFLDGIRFKEKKAYYIVKAREQFTVNSKLKIKEILSDLLKHGVEQAREWLVENVKGMGYKEASHFLRNIGFGENMAILDRHILNTLIELEELNDLPKSLTPRRYKAIENLMRDLSHRIRIPMDHLDLLFWASKTGEVFK